MFIGTNALILKCGLMSLRLHDRCTNKEIAAKMFLSEGTVKQYTNQLYSKLGIGGGVRTKRAQLAELFAKKY